MGEPNYHSVAQGSGLNAGDINQFRGTHEAVIIGQYGNTFAAPTVTGSTTATFIAQPFSVFPGDALSRIEVQVLNPGTASDFTFEIRSDNGSGKPSTTVLFSVLVPAEFITNTATHAWSAGFNMSIPALLPVQSSTSGTLLHAVINNTGAAHPTIWAYSASSSTNGFTASATGGPWTSAGVTFMGNDYSANVSIGRSAGSVVRNTYEDNGAKWTNIDYANSYTAGVGSGAPTVIREYIAGAGGGVRSVRTLTYAANGTLQSVS
jgi:hypothetical protein